MYQTVEGTAELRDLPDDARAYVGRFNGWHHEYRFQTGRQIAIHQRHLELVLEVAHCAKPADDQRSADFPREVHEQSLKLPHLDAALVSNRALDQLDALVGREQRLLRAVVGNRDYELVDEFAAAMNQILMAPRDRIEASCVDRDGRQAYSPVR